MTVGVMTPGALVQEQLLRVLVVLPGDATVGSIRTRFFGTWPRDVRREVADASYARTAALIRLASSSVGITPPIDYASTNGKSVQLAVLYRVK